MIGWLYRRIIVAIIPSGDEVEVSVAAYKKNKRLSKETKRFAGESVTGEITRYLRKFTEETPLYYVAVLNPDPNQGALDGCTIHEISDSEEMRGTKTICRKQKWTLYASAKELEGLKNRYAKIGLDYVFSPFSIIEHFFADKTGGKLSLFILAQKDSLSIAFFEEGRLEYAHHYPMHQKEGSLSEAEDVANIGFSVGVEEEEPSRGINLDQIEMLDDLEIIEDLEDLSDIEDLDALEEIAEFSEEEPVFEEKLSAASKGEGREEQDRFSDDFYRYELIEKTLVRFYGSEHCHNRFVETAYIADAYGAGTELKRFLEEELFLHVVARKIDLGEEVIALSLAEEE